MDISRIEPRRRTLSQLSRVMFIVLLVICTQPEAIFTPTLAFTYAHPLTHIDGKEQQAGSCIPSGDHASIQSALTGVGSKAVLCPDAIFELSEMVTFTADNQQIYTEGFPTDSTRALLKIVHKDVATAVSMDNRAGVKLSHVIIDGNRPELGSAVAGLIESGGNGAGTVVEWVKAYEPRGWSVLVIGHGDDLVCEGAVARNNELGPGGRAEYGLADGISLACRNSIVENNTIVDATDGGIVIFQAPGSLVANNTIRTENRIMFYGISMVDTGPYDGDFTGIRVTGNIIDARGALIRHGIDMGPYVGCIPSEETTFRSKGAVVTNNTLMGDHMAYGFVVSGVEDWTVTGNVDLSTHPAPEREVYCFDNLADPPGGFQLNPATSSGTFQTEFEAATLAFTTEFWTFQVVVSEACVGDLIGAELLEEIKAGSKGPLWFALETAPNGERIGQCISLYQPPDISDLSGDVMVGVFPCEPFCVEVELTNISETDTVDLSRAEFLLEDFPVQCLGLPESLAPGEVVRCTITDFVTPGFQVLRWHGFPPGSGGWGFEYPFEPTAVTPDETQSPNRKLFHLFQNHPNPFNASTIINYTVPEGVRVRIQIKIYDLRGRLTRTLIDEDKPPGRYTVRWDGRDYRGQVVSSGLYFYRIEARDFTSSRKMILLR